MKKLLTAFLLACTCALAGGAVACKDKKPQNGSSDSDSTIVGAPRSVSFTSGEGYSFQSNAFTGSLPEGSQLTFRIELGAFYAGNLTAYVNDEIVLPNAEGLYTYVVGEEDLAVRVEGVRKDVSNMQGSGTMDDAFVVSKPIDLVYIAEQVNKGNRSYATAAYVLANDIDCKGEELQVIGDYSSQEAVFSGSFASGVNENGERERYTISNFSINASDKNYVGLFGAVFADMTVESSGLIYGILLDNFTVSASVNDIVGENKTISCGSLIGYGVGANMYLCDATNGEVNVVADNNYFSFVGGLVGYQQGFYNSAYDVYNPTEISYSKVDVDVNILGGVSLYAGGIVGFATTNYPYGSTAAVHNSYANGSVSGALRSGGVVGGLGRYTVVSNCYATGDVSARSYQSVNSLLLTSKEYCHAYAGGIVGYAENDTIAHDSFFNGSVSATTASDSVANGYSHTDNAIGGGDEAGKSAVDGQKYVAHNCFADVDLSTDAFLTDTLGWGAYNWTFKANELPAINYEPAEETVTLSLTLQYVAPGTDKTITVQGKNKLTQKYFDTSIQSLNSYNSLNAFMGAGLEFYYEADQTNGDVHFRSYGFFFDQACTKRVPLSYMPMRDVTLYVGFADPTPVLGTYKLLADTTADALSLTLKADGTVEYDDGATKLNALYGYDGQRVVLENVRLARYFDGEIVVDEEDTSVFQDANFDLNRYGLYNFAGVPVNGGFHFYDGTFFTAEKPLVAKTNALRGEYYATSGGKNIYYFFYGDKAIVKDDQGEKTYALSVNGDAITLTKGSDVKTLSLSTDLNAYDKFYGSWVKSATVNKVYTFDGMSADGTGTWSYKQISYERSFNGYIPSAKEVELDGAFGTYTLRDGGDAVEFIHNGVTYTAKFDKDGFLEISGDDASSQIYHANNSFNGRWKGNGYDLVLEGIRSDGYGNASMITSEGFTTKLLYEVSETGNVIALYYPLIDDKYKTVSKDYLFGYASYDARYNALTFVSPNGNVESGYAAEQLYLYDDYYGEWVCNDGELSSVNISFNGLGLYSYLGANDLSGVLTLTDGDATTDIAYQLDASLSGKFSYNNKTYQISFDENNGEVKVVIVNEGNTLFERKDEFAGLRLVDVTGTEFCEIDGRSTLSAGGKLSFQGTDYRYFQTATGYDVKEADADTVVGNIRKNENHYLLTLGNQQTELYVANKFMGDWAIGGQYALFKIGPTDLEGVIKATFKGVPVELTYLDAGTLTFKYREDKMPYTYYVFVVEDEVMKTDVLVISEFTNFMLGEYMLCTKANELFGTWEWNRDNGKTTLRFDGISSSYSNGYAELTLTLNHSVITTEYFYTVRDTGIVFWSRELMAERTWYFRLDVVDNSHANDEDAFVLYAEDGETVLKVLKRAEVDGLYLTEAFGEGDVRYIFNGEGKMLLCEADGTPTETVKYEYVIKSYNSDRTATLEVVDVATRKKYSATLDYSDSTHIEFILGDEITENSAA